jgi:hypothetical protein
MKDEEDEGEDEEQVDESAGDMDDQAEHPQGDEEKTDDSEHRCVVSLASRR